MGKLIRKGIDLDEETLKGLKILAVLSDTNTKKYIETVLSHHVKANKTKASQMP
jgi:hypothetical protein